MGDRKNWKEEDFWNELVFDAEIESEEDKVQRQNKKNNIELEELFSPFFILVVLGFIIYVSFPQAAQAVGKIITLKDLQFLQEQKELQLALEAKKRIEPTFKNAFKVAIGQELGREIIHHLFSGSKFLLFSVLNLIQKRFSEKELLVKIVLENTKKKERVFKILEKVLDLINSIPLAFLVFRSLKGVTKAPEDLVEMKGGETDPLFEPFSLILLLFLKEVQRIDEIVLEPIQNSPNGDRRNGIGKFLANHKISLIIGSTVLVSGGIAYYRNKPMIHALINKNWANFSDHWVLILELLKQKLEQVILKKEAELKLPLPPQFSPVPNLRDVERLIHVKALKLIQPYIERRFHSKEDTEKYINDLIYQLRVADYYLEQELKQR